MNHPAWPPLIRADRVPAWVRVRDLVLTISAWAALAYWVRGALLLIADWLSYPFFELSTYPTPDWVRIWSTLTPFVAVSALLAAWLVYWAAQRKAILMRQRWVSQPAPLDPETHAARFGLHASDAASLRELRIGTVRFDAHGAIAAPDSRGFM